jgi:hypothetical protein
VTEALRKARFDRVSRVREEIQSALNFWRRVPLEETTSSPSSKSTPVLKGEDIKEQLRSQPHASLEKHSFGQYPPGEDYDSDATEEFIPFEVASWLSDNRATTPPTHAVDRLARPTRRAGQVQSDSSMPVASNSVLNQLLRQQRSLLRSVDALRSLTESGFEKLNERLTQMEKRREIPPTPPRKPSAYSPRPKNGEATQLWNEVLFLSESKRDDAAYRMLLSAGEEAQLVRLMGRTGPNVLSELDANTCRALFVRVLSLAASGSFIDLCFVWLSHAFENGLASLLPSERLQHLIKVLRNSMDQLSSADSTEIARLHRLLVTRHSRTSE